MTQQPIPWFDQPLDTRERKILTYDRHGIPGLRMIGCHNTSHATAPLPPHYHRDCFEFTYVVQGNLTFHVDHRRYDLSGGDLFLTFPDEIHDTGNAPMSLHRMYWFQLDVRCPEGMLGLDGDFARNLIAALSGLDCRVVRMDPAAEGLFKAAFANLYGGDPLGRLRGSALLAVILCQILHDAALPGSRISPDIARAAAYVRSHIHERITIEDLQSEAVPVRLPVQGEIQSPDGHRAQKLHQLPQDPAGKGSAGSRMECDGYRHGAGVFRQRLFQRGVPAIHSAVPHRISAAQPLHRRGCPPVTAMAAVPDCPGGWGWICAGPVPAAPH